jgi:hypothetical protein
MNPLSDGFVDAEMIAEHHRRLLDAAADRAYLFAREDTARSPSASRRCSRWPGSLFRFWRPIPAMVAPMPLVGSLDASRRECPLARRRCA